MTKARFTSEVLIQNGRIRRSAPIGLEYATPEQRDAVKTVKPVLHAWLKTRIERNPELGNSQILVRGKYVETSNGLTVEFKVQSVVPLECSS